VQLERLELPLSLGEGKFDLSDAEKFGWGEVLGTSHWQPACRQAGLSKAI